jgi:glycosyltransferase involved in cell wall biosynthesis
MKIGLLFNANKNNGGVYQYTITFLEAVTKIKNHQIVIISTSPDAPTEFKKLKNIKIVSLSKEGQLADDVGGIKRIISDLSARYFPRFFAILYNTKLFKIVDILERHISRQAIKTINEEKLDLMFFPTSTNISLHINCPFIVAIHDLQHRINPSFPEVSAGGRWEYREYSYSRIARDAHGILVDSPVGMEDVMNYYHVPPRRIFILPFLPVSYLNSRMSELKAVSILKRMDIPQPYVFYPAKYWPHKNHMRLVKAVEILINGGTNINLILTGSSKADFSTYTAVTEYIKNRGLERKVRQLGYVSESELSALYKKAVAMVMPTYFGPTNIPVLEAWKMNCPVITSNIRGCREQLGAAGLLADPDSEFDLSKKILKLINNSKLRKNVINKGRQKNNKWGKREFYGQINSIIRKFEKSIN